MHIKKLLGTATLLGFAVTLAIGCDQGTNIPLEKAPPVNPGPSQPVPKEKTQGGGPGSSGHMTQSPGANT
jgi:hypothetical protein